MTFNEGQSRLRAGYGARNMAVVRHFALNLCDKLPTSDRSSDGANEPLGTRNICCKSSARFPINLDSLPWSTGPVTEEGKQRSRRNTVRHGLTAETVIGALEDAEDYKAFEAAFVADYNAQSAVARELDAAVSQPALAAAPRHKHGNWTVRNAGRRTS